MTTAAVYVRLSRSRDQDKATESLDGQAAPCRELPAAKGWTALEPPYVDDDRSAYSGRHRPAYERLLLDVRAGKVQAIIAWSADRLTRTPTENEAIIVLADQYQLQLATVTGPVDLGTPAGRMHFRQLGIIARFESEHRGDRVAAWHDRVAAKGGWHGGPRPFGHRYAPSGGLELDEAEAAEIRRAATAILAGASLWSIARAWRERGIVRPVSAKPFTVTQLDHLLRAERLAGWRVHQGARYPAAWPAILSGEQHEALTALLDSRGHRGRRARRLLLSGILRCGRCGTVMRGSPIVGRRGHREPGYRCDEQAGGCGRTHRLAKPLDDFITEAVLVALATPKLRQRFEQQQTDQAARDLGAAINADRARLDGLRDQLADGILDPPDFAHAKRRITDRMTLARAELARLAGRGALADLPDTYDALVETWEGFGDDLDRRRRIIAAVIEDLVCKPVGRGVRFDPEQADRHLAITWRA
jgi:DNA invertase Pin-like site-specific DNA recombinase